MRAPDLLSCRGMRARTAVVLSITAVWLSPLGAGADPGPDLREGDRAMDSLDYARAVAAFERVTNARDAAAVDLVHAYAALVRCQVVLGNEPSARLAAEQLLELDPGARVEGGNIPPRVTRFYEALRREYRRESETLVAVTLPEPLPSGRAMEITARLTRGRRGVASLRMHLQFSEDDPIAVVELEPRDRAWRGRVQVPATFDPDVRSLRYWVEALAVSGTPLGGLGTPDEPMVVAPMGRRPRGNGEEPPDPDAVSDPDPHDPADDAIGRNEQHLREGPGITGKWWFWTGVAVVFAGAALTAVIVLGDEGQRARDGGGVIVLR